MNFKIHFWLHFTLVDVATFQNAVVIKCFAWHFLSLINEKFWWSREIFLILNWCWFYQKKSSLDKYQTIWYVFSCEIQLTGRLNATQVFSSLQKKFHSKSVYDIVYIQVWIFLLVKSRIIYSRNKFSPKNFSNHEFCWNQEWK